LEWLPAPFPVATNYASLKFHYHARLKAAKVAGGLSVVAVAHSVAQLLLY